MHQHRLDKVFSIIAIFVASVLGVVAFDYTYESSYFPRFLALFVMAMAILLLIRLQLAKPDTSETIDGLTVQLKTAISVFAGIAVYSLGIYVFNFELATLMFLAGFMAYLGYRNIVIALLVSLAVAALLYVIFFQFLAVSRPESLLF